MDIETVGLDAKLIWRALQLLDSGTSEDDVAATLGVSAIDLAVWTTEFGRSSLLDIKRALVAQIHDSDRQRFLDDDSAWLRWDDPFYFLPDLGERRKTRNRLRRLAKCDSYVAWATQYYEVIATYLYAPLDADAEFQDLDPEDSLDEQSEAIRRRLCAISLSCQCRGCGCLQSFRDGYAPLAVCTTCGDTTNSRILSHVFCQSE